MNLEHISVAANRVNATSWAHSGLVAVGCSSFISLYNPLHHSQKGVVETLRGHSGRVNALAFFPKAGQVGEKWLISGSADSTAMLWSKTTTWNRMATLSGHTAAIVAVSVLDRGLTALLATAGSDCTCRIWELEYSTNQVKCIQIISMAPQYYISISLGLLPGSQIPILLAGGTDKQLHLYIQKESFERILSAKGHSDWIRSIDLAVYQPLGTQESSQVYGLKRGDLMIATGSQDRYIRVWKITTDQSEKENKSQSIFDDLRDMIDLSDGDVKLSTKAHVFEVQGTQYSLMLDSVLMAHDDWVHSVAWEPTRIFEETQYQPLRLISASADKSIFLWEPDTHSQNWVNKARLGEVGGSTLGFYGAHLSPFGNLVIANGYNGAIHVWKQSDGKDAEWEPSVGVSGHSLSVKEITWDPTGTYILSTSSDQTTRLFAPWHRKSITTWHEIARPQVHGYDLVSITSLGKYLFVSGADEKILRVFTAPKTFVKSLEALTGIRESLDVMNLQPVGASLPALRLSNKAVFENETQEEEASAFTAIGASSLVTTLEQPPFEEHLLQHTLWPEMNKLYGHGYEMMAVTCNHSGTLIASVCKASKAEHAAIRLWNTRDWKQVGTPLLFHSLTVTKLKFSPNDKLLLSVGRDRAWVLYDVSQSLIDASWKIIAKEEKAHARIIWDACWAHDGTFFVTASRDKSIKFWSLDFKNVLTIPCDFSVTSVALARGSYRGGYLLAAGFENGQVSTFQLDTNPWTWKVVVNVADRDCHCLSVTGLSWQPVTSELRLATCSDDSSVRLFLHPL